MNNKKEHIVKRPDKQGPEEVIAEPNKIVSSTPYDFEAKRLTAYGGLLPVATMLEKLGCQQVVEETLTVKRVTRAMPMYQATNVSIVCWAFDGTRTAINARIANRIVRMKGLLSPKHAEGRIGPENDSELPVYSIRGLLLADVLADLLQLKPDRGDGVAASPEMLAREIPLMRTDGLKRH